MTDTTENQTESQTSKVMDHMALYGFEVPIGEADPRDMADPEAYSFMIETIFENVMETFADTSMERDAQNLLWGIVNSFHSQVKRLDRAFDDQRYKVEDLMRIQDGSEINSGALESAEELARESSAKSEQFEYMTSHASDLYLTATGKAWAPFSGSRTDKRAVTASMIDSRDFFTAQKCSKNERHMPNGPKVIVTGGMDYNDHALIFNALDKTHKKYPDMVLVHGGAPKGVDLIASKWASTRKIDQVVFKPDWNKYGKSRAGFVRNDQMLETLPIGVLAFPGTGITENLIDKARGMGIPAKKYN